MRSMRTMLPLVILLSMQMRPMSVLSAQVLDNKLSSDSACGFSLIHGAVTQALESVPTGDQTTLPLCAVYCA
jgi:hypothetical protein